MLRQGRRLGALTCPCIPSALGGSGPSPATSRVLRRPMCKPIGFWVSSAQTAFYMLCYLRRSLVKYGKICLAPPAKRRGPAL